MSFQHAQSLPGFDVKTANKYEDRNLVVGFGREVILQHAETVSIEYFVSLSFCVFVSVKLVV